MKIFYSTSSYFRQEYATTHFATTVSVLEKVFGAKNVVINKFNLPDDGPVDEDSVLKNIKDNEKAIRNCDALVADVTWGSATLGMQIGQAISEKKPLLTLRYKEDRKFHSFSPLSLPGATKNSLYKEYLNEEELIEIANKFAEFAAHEIDTKFLLIIPALIDRYLNWASDYYKKPKAEIVRSAIERELKKDKTWQEYLKHTL